MTWIRCRHGEVACGVVCPGCAAALKSGYPITVEVIGDSNGVVSVAVPALGAVVTGVAWGDERERLESLGVEVRTGRAEPAVRGYSDRTGFTQSCSSLHFREYLRLARVSELCAALDGWTAEPLWGLPRGPQHGMTPAELVAKLREARP